MAERLELSARAVEAQFVAPPLESVQALECVLKVEAHPCQSFGRVADSAGGATARFEVEGRERRLAGNSRPGGAKPPVERQKKSSRRANRG